MAPTSRRLRYQAVLPTTWPWRGPAGAGTCDPPSPGRVRLATTALFSLSGFVFGSWAARVPDISGQVDATPTSLGLALLFMSAGALATMQLTGALCARIGAGLVSAAAAVLLCAATVGPGLVASVSGLGAALLVFGAVTGIVNVAANSLGVRVEAALGHPVLPSLHAGFSFGGLAGALVGGVAGAVGAVAPHLLAVAAAGLLVTALIAPTLVASDRANVAEPAAPEDGGDAAPSSPRRLVVLLGAIAGCTAFGEGALSDWGALHLRETLHATPAYAAAGYAGFCLTMGLGRLGGGRLLDGMGGTRLIVGGALLAAAGMLVAALSPLLWLAIAGFATVGLGLANIFPLAITRAGALGGAAGVGLASTVGYGGLLAGPPLIGFLAEGAGLPMALTTISVLATVAAALAVVIDRRAAAPSALGWTGAASLGPVLLRARATARRGARAALGHAADLPILVDDQGGPTSRPASRASDMDILFG
jgi:hypothetical protein